MLPTFNIKILLIILVFSVAAQPVSAGWVWTPETNKFQNPKYAVKDTPAEQLRFALGFYEAEDYKMATRELKKLLKHYPKAHEAPEAQFYLGRGMEDQGKLYEAFKQYQMVIDKYPFSERSTEIVQRQFEIGGSLLEGVSSKMGIMDKLSVNEYDVIEIFRAVIKNAPYSQLAAPSQYKIGLYLMEKKLHQEARDEFEKVVNDYPDTDWSRAAQYQIAVTDALRSSNSEYDQKVTQAAVEEFEDFVEAFPDAELTKEAKTQIFKLREKEAKNAFLIAAYYEKTRNYTASKIYYQDVVDEYPNTTWASKALAKIQELTELEL